MEAVVGEVQGAQDLELDLLQNFIFSEQSMETVASIETKFVESELFAEEFHPEVFLSGFDALQTLPNFELETPFDVVSQDVAELCNPEPEPEPLPPSLPPTSTLTSTSLMDTLMQQSIDEFKVQKTKQSRKKRVEVADHQKDKAYQVFRAKNNVSAEKSRVKERTKKIALKKYHLQVQERNKALRMKATTLENELARLTKHKQKDLFPLSVLFSPPPTLPL